MLPFFKPFMEDPAAFARQPQDIFDYWSRPLDASDLIEEDFNCDNVRHAKHHSKMQVSFTLATSLADKGDFPVSVETSTAIWHLAINTEMQIQSVTINNKTIAPERYALLQQDIDNAIEAFTRDLLDYVCEEVGRQLGGTGDAMAVLQALGSKLRAITATPMVCHQKLLYLTPVSLTDSYKPDANRRPARQDFTRRVTRKENGKWIKGNTRLRFYTIDTTPLLAHAHRQDKEILGLRFDTEQGKLLPMHQNPLRFDSSLSAIENLAIDDKRFAFWVQEGGIEQALDVHGRHLRSLYRRRGDGIRSLRQFGGTYPAHQHQNYHRSKVNQYLKHERNELIARIEQHLLQWTPMHEAVSELCGRLQCDLAIEESTGEPFNHKEYHTRWASLIDHYHPSLVDWIALVNVWRPNRDNLIDGLTRMHQTGSSVIGWLEAFKGELELANQRDIKRSHKQLSLKERLQAVSSL